MSRGALVVVLCGVLLAACGAPVEETAVEPAMPAPAPAPAAEAFVPGEVVPADIPADIHEDSWARLPTLARDTLDAEGQRVFDSIVGPESRYSAELAILATARELNSQYEWSAHEPLARTAGLEDEIIALVRSGAPLTDEALPGLGEPERAIIRVARELITAPKLSREAFESAQRLFGNEGVMDLAGLIGYYTFVNFTLKTFDVQRAPGTQLLLPLP